MRMLFLAYTGSGWSWWVGGRKGERRVWVTLELHMVGMSTTDAPLHPAEEPESLRQAAQRIRN